MGTIGRARHGRTLREQITQREETLTAPGPWVSTGPSANSKSRASARSNLPDTNAHRAGPDAGAEPRETRTSTASAGSSSEIRCPSRSRGCDQASPPSTSASMIRRSSRERPTSSSHNRSTSRPRPRPRSCSCASAADIRARSATEATRGRNPSPIDSCVDARRKSSNPRRVPAGSATSFNSPIPVRSQITPSPTSVSSSTERRRRSVRLAWSLLERPAEASGSPAATTGRHQPQRSARPCLGSPAPDHRSAHSSHSCAQAPPAAHADRTPPARSRLSASPLAPLQ